MKKHLDIMQNAVRVGKISTGQEKDDRKESTQRHKGGKARAKALPAKRRKAIAKKAAKARWGKD